MLDSILVNFGIDPQEHRAQVLSSGLINATWKISTSRGSYILQRINTNVFKDPLKISGNIDLLATHAKQIPDYLFVAPVANIDGNTCPSFNETDFYRLFQFIEDSHTIDHVSTADQAYEASRQFGKFTSVFSALNIDQLQITIPGFHDLSFRYQQFETSLENGNQERIRQAKDLIAGLNRYHFILEDFVAISSNRNFHQRVTHHDTKISNVLFDKNNKGLCVIDLDTVMPGYFISDVGDMMRTYLSLSTEEDTDLKNIQVRDDVFKAIAVGYLEQMNTQLSKEECHHFVYAGSFLIYMQALRFLTDYFNNDKYYTPKHPEHNFMRALNQFALLERIEEKRNDFEKLIAREVKI